jgi:hypothetical protein
MEATASVGQERFNRPTMEELVEWALEEPPPVGNLAELLDSAAVGIVKHSWRNSPWEDAHADPASPLTDGEMMRSNAATTRLVREFLRDFFRDSFEVDVPSAGTVRISDSGTLAAGMLPLDECDFLDDFDDGDSLADSMLSPLFVALTSRVLPCGYTVREVAAELYPELEDHVAANLNHFAEITDRHSLRAALYLKAKAAEFERWWLGPDWSDVVDALAAVIAEPEHHHWDIRGYPELVGRPGRCRDIEQLAVVLIQGPDRLSAAEAEWCVEDAGIDFALHHVRSEVARKR